MLRRVVGALVSGGVLCLAFPTFDVWIAAPVSLGLLALVLTGVRPRAGLGLGFLAGLAFFLPTLHWAGVYVGNLPWIALAPPSRRSVADPSVPTPSVGFSQLLSRREFWGTSLGFFCLGYTWFFLVSWLAWLADGAKQCVGRAAELGQTR